MYIPQKEKLIKLASSSIPDGLSMAKPVIAQLDIPLTDWSLAQVLPGIWDNLVTFAFSDGSSGITTASFTTDRLILAYFWKAETYGLTMMYKRYNIRTLADVCAFSRGELCGKDEIGPVTIGELDRILQQLHLKYKDGRQLLLFPESFPPLP